MPGRLRIGAVRVRDPHQLAAERPGRCARPTSPTLPKPCTTNPAAVEVRRPRSRRASWKHVDDAAARRRLAPVGALEGDRLAGHAWRACGRGACRTRPSARPSSGRSCRRRGPGCRGVGPRTLSILSMNERATVSSSLGSQSLGIAVDAALRAAEGDARRSPSSTSSARRAPVPRRGRPRGGSGRRPCTGRARRCAGRG